MSNQKSRRDAAILKALNERHSGVGAKEHAKAVSMRFGVRMSTVTKIKEENNGMTTEAPPAVAQRAGQAPTLLRVLQERGKTRRGWAEASPRELVAITGIDIHDVSKTLRQFKQQGIVKFTEHTTRGSEGRISAIRLTQKGVNMNYQLAPEPAWQAEYAERAVTNEPQVNGQEPEPEPTPEAVAPEPTAPEPEPTATIEPSAATILPVTLAEYPLLRNLVRRKALLLEAAKASEAAGAEDVAIMLYERAEKVSYTPEQQEMIRFLLAIYPGEAPLPFEDAPLPFEMSPTAEPEPAHAT